MWVLDIEMKHFAKLKSHVLKYTTDVIQIKTPSTEDVVKFHTCVLAAGPWISEVGAMAGIGKGDGDLFAHIPVELR